MMTQTLRDMTHALLAELRSGHDKGVFSDDIYHKCIVSVAYEFLAAEETDDGVKMLSRLPVSYYRDVVPSQVAEDPDFAFVVQTIAQKLTNPDKFGFLQTVFPQKVVKA